MDPVYFNQLASLIDNECCYISLYDMIPQKSAENRKICQFSPDEFCLTNDFLLSFLYDYVPVRSFHFDNDENAINIYLKAFDPEIEKSFLQISEAAKTLSNNNQSENAEKVINQFAADHNIKLCPRAILANM